MKNIQHILATALILLGFATSGFAQTQQKLEELKAKTLEIAENATAGAAAFKKANPNPSAIVELDFFNGSYDTLTRTTYSYNANGDILQETTYDYNFSTGTFELGSRGLYTYNSSNQPTEYLVQSWEDTVWADEMRQSISYTTQGDYKEILIEVWTGTTWITYFGLRLNYTYNSLDMFTEIIIQQRNQLGAWVDVQKQIITYGPNDEPTEILNQVYTGSAWESSSKLINMTWHRWGGLDEQQFSFAETETWDGSQWIKSSRETYTYNNADLPLTYLLEDWDVNTFVNNARTTWTYDAYGNLKLNIQEEYDISVPQWDTVSGGKSEYTYNNDNSINTEVFSTYGSLGWETDGKYLYEYQNPSGISKKTSQTALEVYPNPTADVLNLKLDAKNFTIRITDLSGRMVLTAQNETLINVGNLSHGIYLVNVTSEKGSATIKFVKN